MSFEFFIIGALIGFSLHQFLRGHKAFVFPLILGFVLLSSVMSYASCESGEWGLVQQARSAGGLQGQNGHWCCKTNCTAYYCPNEQLCSSSNWCKNNDFRYEGYYYSDCDGCSTQQQNSVCNAMASLNHSGAIILTCRKRCTSECDAKENTCNQSGGVWDASSCTCAEPPPPPDTTWHCQDAGGAVEGGFGSPLYAKLFKCVGDVCENTRDLHGTCSDWGFCPTGVSDCTINDSLGRPPCGRSGGSFSSSNRCVYACADGKDLNCKPLSTQYVAGNIYVGECPSSPPGDCRPGSSSSSSSSSASSSPSSSPSYSAAADTIEFPGNDGKDYEIDYTAILAAILDTLHRANVQRDFQLELSNASKIDLDAISQYSGFSYTELQKQTSKLNAIASDGLPYPTDVKQDISDSRDLLDNINNFLRSDSLLTPRSDTSYNPLLRDIKGAIDSINVTVSLPSDSSGGGLLGRDSAFAKWWSKYYADSAQSNSVVGKALKDFVPSRDSVRASDCSGFVGCMAIYSDMGYCSGAWGVSMSDCVDGGTPIDNVVNVETSILDKITKAFWGPDTVTLSYEDNGDTNVTPDRRKDTAESWISLAFNQMFSPESTTALLNKVDSMKTAAENAQKDSVKVQPDSMWLDTSKARQYARHMLLPSGTGNDCFVCHADLGNFGGLTSDNLSIHIDFSNFGGFNFCDIVRAVIKIMTFVVCMSLTLGSWAAAFGYNPKNDA